MAAYYHHRGMTWTRFWMGSIGNTATILRLNLLNQGKEEKLKYYKIILNIKQDITRKEGLIEDIV